MLLEIENIKDLFLNWEVILSKDQKKNIHFYSFRNFVFHYNNLSDRAKQNVLQLLNEYVHVVKEENFYFRKTESYDLASKFLNKVADFYSGMNFRLNLRFSFIIYWGIIIDTILYFLDFLPKINVIPIPILSCLMLSYYLYIMIFKKPKKLVYGLFY